MMCKELPDIDFQVTNKERAFAKAYVQTEGNGLQAAKLAGCPDSGYLRQAAHIMLKRPHVQNLIRDFYKRVLDEIDVDVKTTIQELAAIGFSDIGNLYNDKDELLKIKKMPRLTRVAVESIDTVKSDLGNVTTKKVKMHSKMKALEMIAKYLGMYEEENNKKPDINLNIQFV